MARARNWLGSVALKPYHSWVYWRDVDVETIPTTIMEDLMHHDKDVIVPNVWRPLPDWLGNIQPYDLNSWKESEGGLQLANALDEDAVIVEGYPEYATWRPHLAYMRDPNGNRKTKWNWTVSEVSPSWQRPRSSELARTSRLSPSKSTQRPKHSAGCPAE